MLKAFSIVLLIVTGLYTSQSNAQDRAEVYAFYQSLREELHEAFKTSMGTLLLESKRQGQTDTDRAGAIEGLKSLVYNKAFIYIQCYRRAPRGGDLNLSNRFFNDCVSDRQQAMQRVFNFASTKGLDRSVAPRVNQCMDQGRAKEAEADFPPFDFLIGPGLHLYDMKQVDDCFGRFSFR